MCIRDSGMIEDLGLQIHCDARVTEFLGDDKVSGMVFSNEGWDNLDVGMVVVSAGIRWVIFPLLLSYGISYRVPTNLLQVIHFVLSYTGIL